MQCIRCQKIFVQSEKSKDKKISQGYDPNICSGCFRVLNTLYKDKLTPDALYYGPRNNPFSWEVFQKNRDVLSKSTKLFVEITCEKCGKKDIRRIDKIIHSKYANNIQICNNCIMNYVTSLDEWKTTNSKAQKVVQSSQDVKNKIKKSISLTFQKDKFFALKRSIGKGRFLKGFFRKKWFFASSYELSFLYQNEDKNVIYCTEKIPYLNANNEWHIYTPDFQINDTLFEIKGDVKTYFETKKMEYAMQYCERRNKKFKIITQDDLDITFLTPEELLIFEPRDLIITSVPYAWNTDKIESFLWDKNSFVKKIQKNFEHIESKEAAKKLIDFYIRYQNVNLNELDKKNDNSFFRWYNKVIHSKMFLLLFLIRSCEVENENFDNLQ